MNMTSDGTNTYEWDAENRLIKINYPGAGNASQFVNDQYGRTVKIVEISSGILSSNKHFVWSGTDRCEERDSFGAAVKRFFGEGQINGSANLFYTRDFSDSIREASNGAGEVQESYSYSPYGETEMLNGGLFTTPEFLYCGYYYHQRSGLSLMPHRPYSARLGRWIAREPVNAEAEGTNLYAYVDNSPIEFSDSDSLSKKRNSRGGKAGPWSPPVGVKFSCKSYDSCAVLLAKMFVFNKSIKSHEGWDEKVPAPRGGGKHKEEICTLKKGLKNCQSLFAKKCNNSPQNPSEEETKEKNNNQIPPQPPPPPPPPMPIFVPRI